MFITLRPFSNAVEMRPILINIDNVAHIDEAGDDGGCYVYLVGPSGAFIYVQEDLKRVIEILNSEIQRVVPS